jgi:hypothetical protein
VLKLNWQLKRQKKRKVDRNVREARPKRQWKESMGINKQFIWKEKKMQPKSSFR